MTGDCAAKRREKGGEGGKKRWFNVRAPLSLWSKPPSALLAGNTSPLLLRQARFTETLTGRRGWVSEKAKQGGRIKLQA